jgi:crossover junction endodeoxyribonuclease RuvC
MKVVGIDPSLVKTGWGVVEFDGDEIIHVAHGIIKPKTTLSTELRLAKIYSECVQIAATYDPKVVCIEDTYCGVNPKTTIRLGYASGVIMAAFGGMNVPVARYPAKIIKRIVGNKGSADKHNVGQNIIDMLSVEVCNLDSSDALAAAVAYVMSGGQFCK